MWVCGENACECPCASELHTGAGDLPVDRVEALEDLVVLGLLLAADPLRVPVAGVHALAAPVAERRYLVFYAFERATWNLRVKILINYCFD